jgi:hypothetical protein
VRVSLPLPGAAHHREHAAANRDEHVYKQAVVEHRWDAAAAGVGIVVVVVIIVVEAKAIPDGLVVYVSSVTCARASVESAILVIHVLHAQHQSEA